MATPQETTQRGPGARTAPSRDETTRRRSGWTWRRITSVAIATVLILLSLVLLGVGGAALWADRTQRDGGYITTDVHEFSTSGSALASRSTELGSAGVGWSYPSALLGEVRIRATPTSSGGPLFVGIGPSAEVDRYLAGVDRAVITDFWGEKTKAAEGGTRPSPPRSQHFWAASVTGSGPQTLVWDPAEGSWTVVVMNADGRPGVAVGADLGARMPAALWIAIGVLAAGVLFMAGGALLVAGAFPRNRTFTSEREGGVMSTSSITVAGPHASSGREEEIDRRQAVKQYSLAKILAVWAAAALPMGVLAWVVAPKLADRLSGDGNVPMAKALIVSLTLGLIWQFVLVAALVWREQRTLRWATIREALWLRSPRSPRSGRVGGRIWLVLIPLIVAFGAEELISGGIPTPANRDMGAFLDSDAGQSFMSGNWGWFGLILALLVFNTVFGEELLFRGLLLPRMNGAFGRRDWLANGVVFALYHLHMPWAIPTSVLDTFILAYPTKRYRSAWIGIAVHSAQSVVIAVIALTLVL
jgi:uncharacterized protein